jgi:predicted Zn-dependent protease
MAHDRLRQYAEAVKDWDMAVALSSKPEEPVARAARATARINAGQVAEAVAEVAELSKTLSWHASQWYEFARVCAVASGKGADSKRAYADRAMQLLWQAVQAGYRDVAHMQKDAALDPLRTREDFQKLLAELAKRSATMLEKAP